MLRRGRGDRVVDGGVSDAEYKRTRADIVDFLRQVGFTAKHTDPPHLGAPVSNDESQRGFDALAGDVRDFPREDIGEVNRRYRFLVNIAQRHTAWGVLLATGHVQAWLPACSMLSHDGICCLLGQSSH